MIGAVLAAVLAAAPVVVPAYEPVPVDALARVLADEWQVTPDLARTVAGAAVVGGWAGDVHPAWLVVVAAGETGGTFRAAAVGDRGRSLGLCQIQIRSARTVLPAVTRADLLDPWWNVVAAGLFYGRLIQRYGRSRAHTIYGCGFRCRGSTPAGRWKMRRFRRIVVILEGET